MSTDTSKRFDLFIAIISLIFACVMLIIYVYELAILNFSAMFTIPAFIGFIIYEIALFFVSAQSFIKYGIACGIDYALKKNSKEDSND